MHALERRRVKESHACSLAVVSLLSRRFLQLYLPNFLLNFLSLITFFNFQASFLVESSFFIVILQMYIEIIQECIFGPEQILTI